jgi:hypothetical protein
MTNNKIIYSFDCAIKNLGFCCISVNTNWREEANDVINRLDCFYAQENTDNTLDKMCSFLQESNKIIDSVFEIKYMNIFDLAAEGKAKETKLTEVVKRLKYIMFCLEKQLPKPDIVLIEYQMNVNDKSRGISRYIEEYYLPLGDTDARITYAMSAYPLAAVDIPVELTTDTKIHIIAPTLKNSYQTDPSEAGDYQTYILKHNTNYAANKAHAVHNFKHFVESRGLSHTIYKIPNKLDDIADAFMQAYGWCKANNYF